MSLIDARYGASVYVKFFGNGIISHPGVLEMDDASLFGR
jgi:hypothetical protein